VHCAQEKDRWKWLVENRENFSSEEILKTAQVMAQQR
jgi:hypothetical protein